MKTFQSKTHGSSDSRSEWITRAACRDAEPELWFSPLKAAVDAAKNVCRACPVRTFCLADVLETEAKMSIHDTWGVAGGLSADQRRALRARTKDAAA